MLFVSLSQLRVRDLDGALDVEKSANNEANKAIDRLTKQIRYYIYCINHNIQTYLTIIKFMQGH